MFIPEYLNKEIQKFHPDYFIYFNPEKEKLQIRCWITSEILRLVPSLRMFYSIPFFRNPKKYTHNEILKKSLLVKEFSQIWLDNRLVEDVRRFYVPPDQVTKVLEMIDKSNEELQKFSQDELDYFSYLAKEIRDHLLDRQRRYSK